jgi:3-hydroxyisobutyryl-CoA hydrolase
LAKAILLKGAGEKAFCAGGDVAGITTLSQPDSCGAQLTVALARSNVPASERQRFGRNYFKNEYTLDYYIATYPKPMIAIMDGITSKYPLIPRSFAS